MVRFPSAEWAATFRESLNRNDSYAEAARAWEGDILLLVAPDERSASGEGIYLDLFHGTCRAASYVADPARNPSEFVFQARRDDWARLFRHELDPVKAILDRTFRIQGNLAKVARFTRAAKELVETAASIPTEL